MTTARAELKDMDLINVVGGMDFDEATKTIAASKSSQRYIGVSDDAMIAFLMIPILKYFPGADEDAYAAFEALSDEEKIQAGVKAGLLVPYNV